MFIQAPQPLPDTAPACEARWFSETAQIHYAQCWEDADVLLAGLNIQPGDTCLAVASAGDNALAMLCRQPAQVIAVDMNPAQLACLALRVAAYRELEHTELLALIGSRPYLHRASLYARCRHHLSAADQAFWDNRLPAIERGIGSAGRFERYLALFRRWILPLIHPKSRVDRLLHLHTRTGRHYFYNTEWDTWRWRLLFHLFFSRLVMGHLGRHPDSFRYVEGRVADQILQRVRHGLTHLEPSSNPYLHWMLTGRHECALPFALRPENFETIRANLHRLSWHCASVEGFLAQQPTHSIDRFNLSDIFEYTSEHHYHRLLERLISVGRTGGRLVYWNMLTPRHRPESLADRLLPITAISRVLHREDNAFFYSDLVIEALC